jgi:hypothetical protein
LGQLRTHPVSGDSFAEGDLRHAALQASLAGGAGLLDKFCLIIEEVEGAGDDLGGFAEVSLIDFALDALLGGGIEGDGYGGSIRGVRRALRRRSEPAAERERLRRGCFVARVNACPAGWVADPCE